MQSKDSKNELIDDEDLIINRDNIGSKLGMELN
jgi:hypothetical protein